MRIRHPLLSETAPQWRQQPRLGAIAVVRVVGALALAVALSGPAFAAERPATDPREAMAAIDHKARDEKIALASAWLLALDLTAPAVPALGADPRDSEKAEHTRLTQVRARLTAAAELQKRLRATPTDQATQAQVVNLVGSTEPNAFVPWWIAYQAAK